MPTINLLPIKQAVKFGANDLPDSDTAELDSQLILLHVLNANRNILFTHPDQLLTQDQQKQFVELIGRRKKGEPVAYIIGEQGFWDLTLKTAPHTLIPRPDTESIIDWILEKGLQPKRILDLGTGTGALALALAKEFPDSKVIGLDLVPEAVELAKQNQVLNNINNAEFLQSSWFENISHENQFDLIVSNPPYIDKEDNHLAEGDVRFEPSSALVADESGYSDLFHIAQYALAYLEQNGLLVMEHGWQQAEKMQQKLNRLGYINVGSGLDLGNRERFTFGRKP